MTNTSTSPSHFVDMRKASADAAASKQKEDTSEVKVRERIAEIKNFERGILFACEQISALVEGDEQIRAEKGWPLNNTAVKTYIAGARNQFHD